MLLLLCSCWGCLLLRLRRCRRCCWQMLRLRWGLLLRLRRRWGMLLRHRWCAGRLRRLLLRWLMRRSADGANDPRSCQGVEGVADRCCLCGLHGVVLALVGGLFVLVVGAHQLSVGGHLGVLLGQDACSEWRELVLQCTWRGGGFLL